MTFASWEDVARFALTLPDSDASTSYGQPAIETRGKATGHEAGSFHVASRKADGPRP